MGIYLLKIIMSHTHQIGTDWPLAHSWQCSVTWQRVISLAHAQELPSEQRKAYAEKVVLAFWDAIGGDEEEVKDLDDL